eukprot:2394743-Rhodomonas_salina.1
MAWRAQARGATERCQTRRPAPGSTRLGLEPAACQHCTHRIINARRGLGAHCLWRRPPPMPPRR